MNTDTIKMKQCRDCKELFPKTEVYFSPIFTPYGTRIFQSYCRKCGAVRSNRSYWKKKSKSGVSMVIVKKSYRGKTGMEIPKPAFTVNSLNGHRCVRCSGVLEERNMKYEPGVGEEILGKYIYYNCPFCGQDYYPEEGACECVGVGTL